MPSRSCRTSTSVKGVLAPFAGPDSFPVVDLSTDEDGNFIKPLPVISDLLYLEKNGGVNDQSRAVWLQTSLYINTTPGNSDNVGFDQQSFVNVALGGVENGGLVGAQAWRLQRRLHHEIAGLSAGCQTTTREAFAFTGDIATLAGPDGSHFLGKDEPNIVIGFDSTGTHNIGRDIPLRSEFLFGREPIRLDLSYRHRKWSWPSQPEQTLEWPANGYAVGMMQSEIPSCQFRQRRGEHLSGRFQHQLQQGDEHAVRESHRAQRHPGRGR